MLAEVVSRIRHLKKAETWHHYRYPRTRHAGALHPSADIANITTNNNMQREEGKSDISGLNPGGLLGGVVKSDTAEFSGGGHHDWQPPSPGDLNNSIDVFEVTGLIGRGGMGAVYHARQVSLGRDVAIKILPKELSTNEVFARRFRREARSLAMLQHPGIVTVYDFGQTANGILYLVMEFINGPHLGQLIRIEELDLRQKLDIILQVCDSLIHAHEQGFVHRDLKPANILVARDGKAKLVDFGLARLVQTRNSESDLATEGAEEAVTEDSVPSTTSVGNEMLEKISFEIRNPLNAIIGYSEMLQEDADETTAEDLKKINEAGQTVLDLIRDRINNSEVDLEKMKLFLNNDLSQVTASGAVVGTGDYMAPEQFEGAGEPDPRTDVYSLGVVLYELLTGTRPRGRWKHATQLIEDLDPRLDFIIDKALEPDRDERFQNIGELRDRLLEVRERLGNADEPAFSW